MALLDSILNFAFLLLWLNWRSLRLDPVANSMPTTLVGTLKSTRPSHLKGWQMLVGLFLLVILRVVVCEEIGSPVDWTPKLDLGLVSLAFRSDNLGTSVLYALVSSLRLLLVFYFWVLVLVALNRANPEPDAIQRLLRSHLGRIARWPATLQVLLPITAAAGLWMGLQPVLSRWRVVLPANSITHLLGQGLLVGAGLLLSLKYLIPAVLLLYLVSSYVYLGSNPIWDFCSATSRNILAPLRGLSLRLGRLDLAPLVGIAGVVALLHWLPIFIVKALGQRNLTIWPH